VVWLIDWMIYFFTVRSCYLCKYCKKQLVVLKKGNWGKVLLYCQQHCMGVRAFDQCDEYKRCWLRRLRSEKGDS
jgi:hypothetical protein